MTNQLHFAKPPGKWVMKITADRRIEVNEDVTVTEAAQTVLETVQKLLNQPERKPLTDQEIEATFLSCNGRWDGDRWVIEDADFHPFVRAITALRERLEQPKGLFIDMIAAHGPEFVEEVRRVGENIEQQAEPVAWVFAPNNELLWPSEVEVTNPIEIDSYQPLYTSPPQRKPLNDADIKLVMDGRGEEGDDDYIKPAFDPYGISEGDLIDFARAIEQAHGIKETP